MGLVKEMKQGFKISSRVEKWNTGTFLKAIFAFAQIYLIASYKKPAPASKDTVISL